MPVRKKRVSEATLLELLRRGDLAGFAIATGMTRQQIERMLNDEGSDDGCRDDNCAGGMGHCSSGDDLWSAADGDFPDDDFEERLRPQWLHQDCRNVCAALELGTCCLYPDNPLVRIAVDLAESTAQAASRIGEAACGETGAELARWFRLIPGLLAQVHAVLPRLNKTALSQLLCPVGTLAGALDTACGAGCPWGCGESAVPDRRAEFGSYIELVAECSAAIRVSLARLNAPARKPIVVRPRQPRE